MSRKRTKQQVSTEDEEEDVSLRDVPNKRVRKVAENVDKENHTDNAMQVVETLQAKPVSRNLPSSVISEKIAANLKSGKLKRILLQNFMCHSNFEVTLNKCVNVIVGLNGSGKSAILTAIAIGLGSRATATARSTNLKDLVRRGEHSATIEITLANDGIDAYDHAIFGDQITVVRTINGNTGASTYKLKNHQNRVVSTSRQDLVKMCMCLNIQVENPVLILNQDAARSFLKECDPKKLYSLFMKATQIETIIEKLNSCFKTAVAAKNQLESLQKSIKLYESDIQVIRQKHTRLQSVKALRKKIADTQNEIAWVQVAKVEKELSEVRRDLDKKQTEVKRLDGFINNKEAFEKEQKEKICEYGTKFKTLEEAAKGHADKTEQARKVHDTESNKLSEFENSLKTNVDRLNKKIIPNIAQLEQEIDEFENNPANVDKMRQENEAKIAAIEEKLGDLKHVMDNCKRDYHNFLQNVKDNETETQQYRAILGREQDKVLKMENQIAQYRNAGKDKLSVYGNSMSQFLQEVEKLYRQKRFSEMPRGPFGRFIEVPQHRYRQAVENILGNFVTAFAVNNDKDRALLMQMKKKYQNLGPIQIITTEFVHQAYDVSNGIVQLETEGEVLYHLIKVQDPVVMNCLIDQRKIEKIVLVDNQQLAVQLTQNVENVPHNLMRVVLINPFSDYYPAPKYRSYSLHSRPTRYIHANFEELISAIQRDKGKQEQKCKEAQAKMRDIAANTAKFNKLVNDKKNMMNDLQRKHNQYTNEIKTLREIDYPENTDIDYLRNQLDEEKQRKISFEKKIEQSTKKQQVLKEIVQKCKTTLDRLNNEGRQSRDEMFRMKRLMEVAQRDLDVMKNEIDTKGRQIASLKEEERNVLNQALGLEGKVKNMTSKIKGKRVHSNNNEEYLKQNIRSAENRIATIESSNENIEDVELLLNNKLGQVQDMKQVHKTFEAVMKRLSELRESRYMFVRKLRQHMTLRVKHKFHQLMQLRNYSADIEIDHKVQQLTLKVIPRDGQVEGAVSNTKSLSGGERSYSTVAFLISLWNCVDHPFYFLDEYDVFSDEYNRHIMTMLLLNEADKRKDKQFGFLTPQEFSNIEASETITIHKLRDPERMDD